MGPQAALLPDGGRLHLQHGPIDLIIGVDGDKKAAFTAAQRRFETVLQEIMDELPQLRLPQTLDKAAPAGTIAKRMHAASRLFCNEVFVTPMAAVAGTVAETVLAAIKTTSPTRAYVNNGGDIALHLTEGQSFSLAMVDHGGRDLGRITIDFEDPIRGIATSGRFGRSRSLGIADSVTVLAETAAVADVAATLVANAVDLPEHPDINRVPASVLDDNSELGDLPVVAGYARLSLSEASRALANGRARADRYIDQNLISGAALFLQEQADTTCPAQLSIIQRTPPYA